MKKLWIITLVSVVSTLFAAAKTVPGEGIGVRTETPQRSERVYLGSFLAKGALPAEKIYRIDAPVEGIVRNLSVHLYEPVKKGQKLLLIKSPELLELEAKYIETMIQVEYYEAELARLKPLYEAAVVAKKRYLEAQNTLTKYRTQSGFYRHLLVEWGVREAQVKRMAETKMPQATIEVTAPIDGMVDEMAVYPKMYVSRGEHMMTIVDPEGVHMVVALPLDIARRLTRGSKLYVGDTPVHVESIASSVDPRTQTVSVHLLSEKKSSLMAGEKRNVKLYWPKKAYRLPASALIDYDDRPALFVKSPKGYELHYVTLLSRSGNEVYILSPELTEKSEVAVSGVIALKGALEGAEGD
ncbi:efflux RND transporter periplasmic adaptor subunit [Hydrogenimonas sp.]